MSKNKKIKEKELNKVTGAGFQFMPFKLPNEDCSSCGGKGSVRVYNVKGMIHKTCLNCDYSEP